MASVGALAGISLVSVCVDERRYGADTGRLASGTFPTPTSNPDRAARPAVTAPAKAAGPTTVSFMSWWWTEPRRAAAWRALVERFHAAQKDVRVEEAAVPLAEYARTVLGGIATASLQADTLTFPDEIAVRLIRSNQLAELDAMLDRLGIRSRLDQAAQAGVTRDGRTFGLLASMVPSALVYNRALYAAAGVTGPPTTPDEYVADASRLTLRPERFGHAGRVTVEEAAGWWIDLTQWVLAYGGTWARAKRPLVDAEPVLRAVRTYKSLYDAAMPQAVGSDDIRRLVSDGKVGQYLASVAELEAVPAPRTGLAASLLSAPPPWEGRRSVAQATYVGILGGSRRQAASRTWWEFAFRPDNVQEILERSGDVIPVYAGALRDGAFQDQEWARGFQAATPVVLSSTIEGFEASVGEFRRIVLERVREVLAGGKAPEVALREAQQGLEDLASRQ